MTQANANTPPSRGRRSRTAAIAAILACAAGLSGCSLAMTRHEIVGSVPDDYRTRHPIVLADALAVLDIPAGMSVARLPSDARTNVVAFGDRFLRSSSPVLAIVTPSGSANQAVAKRLAGEIRQVLAASGVPPQAMDLRVYAALPRDTEAPVRLAFSRVTAQTDQCGQWPDQTTWNPENRNYENFGCATQQNLAAIVANPLDLAYPRGTTPPDAERRAAVLDKYRQGSPYQTTYSLETKSSISGVGQ